MAVDNGLTETSPYLIDASTDGVVFMCFSDSVSAAIWRITSGIDQTTTEWAYGAWGDRKFLSYIPINDIYEVPIYENNFAVSLEVSFQRLKQDLLKRGRGRLLWQFRNSNVIGQIVEKMSEQFQSTYDATVDLIEKRTLDKAEGVNLEILGRIVGQTRPSIQSDLISYFTPDKGGFSVDQVGVWVANASLSGAQLAPDNYYRNLILSKIFKNHAQGGSNPEVRYCAKFLTNYQMTLVKIGLQEYRMAFPYGVSADVIKLLKTPISNKQVNNYYIVPIPATVKIDETAIYIMVGQAGFGPDTEDGRPDFAKASLTIAIGGL